LRPVPEEQELFRSTEGASAMQAAQAADDAIKLRLVKPWRFVSGVLPLFFIGKDFMVISHMQFTKEK
jgi:hypothetical protein